MPCKATGSDFIVQLQDHAHCRGFSQIIVVVVNFVYGVFQRGNDGHIRAPSFIWSAADMAHSSSTFPWPLAKILDASDKENRTDSERGEYCLMSSLSMGVLGSGATLVCFMPMQNIASRSSTQSEMLALTSSATKRAYLKSCKNCVSHLKMTDQEMRSRNCFMQPTTRMLKHGRWVEPRQQESLTFHCRFSSGHSVGQV